MRLAIFGSNKRPLVGSQNTGRDAYVRPLIPANVTVNGMGGFANFRSLSPFNIAGINPAMLAKASISGIGNDMSTNPVLQPLIDQNKPKQF